MDPILQILLSWQFVFFGLAIAAIMYVLRLIVEYVATLLKKNLADSKLWNDLLLPILPVIFGAISAYFLKLFPYPGFPDGARGYVIAGDRIIFGLVAGLLSTLMYRVIKALLYQKVVSVVQNFQNPAGNQPSIPESITEKEIPTRGQL